MRGTVGGTPGPLVLGSWEGLKGGGPIEPGGRDGGLGDLGSVRDGSLPNRETGDGGGGMTMGLRFFSFSRAISSLDRTKAVKGGGAGGVGGGGGAGGVGGFRTGFSGFASTTGGSSTGLNSSTRASAEIGSMLLEAVDTW